jgi:hypothetical protein
MSVREVSRERITELVPDEQQLSLTLALLGRTPDSAQQGEHQPHQHYGHQKPDVCKTRLLTAA